MENRICDLPDDLLLEILLRAPTKVAVATTVLSKRWRSVSTMLSQLNFEDDGSESLGCFIEQSLQLHKAPRLEWLTVKVGPRCCSIDIDIRKWVEKAVSGGVYFLEFSLLWTAAPTSFPKSLYTCDTLGHLTLSNEILVDVSSPAHLPSLTCLCLFNVVYKDQDSLVRLLSSSPILRILCVERHEDDNLKKFTVKVPSLKTLSYETSWRKDDDDDDRNGLLVIDSPALVQMLLTDYLEDYCLIENMPCLDEAWISYVFNPHDKFLRSISSVRYLLLCLTQPLVEYCSAIKFSWLIEFYFRPDESVDWLEPFILLVQNSPKLKTLIINTNLEGLPLSWNQPTCIPRCLSCHLEMFEWIDYGGREDEKQLVTYILANSKCLKTVYISFRDATSNLEEKKKELECLPRISTSSQLLFPTQVEWRFRS